MTARSDRGVALRTNLILLGILVVLAAIALLGGDRRARLDPVVAKGLRLFDGFDPEAARKVRIVHPSSDPLTLTWIDGGWTIDEADGYRADERKVQSALAKIARWRRDLVVGGTGKHDELRVSEGTGQRVTVLDAAGETLADVYVGNLGGFDPDEVRASGGNLDPESLTVYIRRADEDEVYLVRDFLLGVFGNRVRDWLARPLVPAAPSQAVAFEAVRHAPAEGADAPPPPLRIAREAPAAPWGLGERRLAVDEATVKRMVSAFTSISPNGVVGRDEDLAALGLEPPRAELALTLADGAEHRLLVGGAVDPDAEVKQYHVKLAASPFVVVVNAASVDLMLETPERVVARQVAPFAPQQVTSLAINIRPQQPPAAPLLAGGPIAAAAVPPAARRRRTGLLLRKEGSGWFAGSGESRRSVDPNTMTRLLGEMTRLPIADFVARGAPDPAWGLGEARIDWDVALEGGERNRLAIGRRGPDGRYWARRAGQPWTVSVEARAVRALIDEVRRLAP